MPARRARPCRIPVGPDGLPRHALTADGVLFHGRSVLLVRRGHEPFKGRFAFPGGFVEGHESADEAVLREMKEETGLSTRIEGLIGFYSQAGRDPRGPTATAVYLVSRTGGALRAGDDAAAARFVPVAAARRERLAFDHDQVLSDALLYRAALSKVMGGAPSRNPGARRRTRTRR